MFVLGGEAVQVTESWYFPLLFWDKDTIDVLKIIATQYSSKGWHFKKQCRKIPALVSKVTPFCLHGIMEPLAWKFKLRYCNCHMIIEDPVSPIFLKNIYISLSLEMQPLGHDIKLAWFCGVIYNWLQHSSINDTANSDSELTLQASVSFFVCLNVTLLL